MALTQLIVKERDTTNNYSYKNNYSKNDFEENSNSKFVYEKENLEAALFYFDPNTISENDWHRLGVKTKTANGIQNYIAKGGKFRAADDINKIWGISDELKARLIPFVKIVLQENSQKNYSNNYPPYEKKVYEKKTIAPIDINLADSAAFEALPAIGGGYAKSIVNFRKKLGGFYKVDQVAETFGLPDSTFQKVKPYLKFEKNHQLQEV